MESHVAKNLTHKNQLLSVFFPTNSEVKKKWKKLRDRFRKELKKEKEKRVVQQERK